jgi:hypothetical protein
VGSGIIIIDCYCIVVPLAIFSASSEIVFFVVAISLDSINTINEQLGFYLFERFFFSGAFGAFLFFLIGKIFGEKLCTPLPSAHPLTKITPNRDLRNIVFVRQFRVKTRFSHFPRVRLSFKFRQNHNSVKYVFRNIVNAHVNAHVKHNMKVTIRDIS